MARVLITGSSDGLGLMAGRLLAEQGQAVTLHARNAARAEAARAAFPQAEAVLVGDVSTVAAMRDVAKQANAAGRFDAVIHNVALGYREPRRVETADGLSRLWAVNVDRPPRRALLAAVLAVILLAGVGLLVAKGLLDMSRLQDCAATGRRDC